MVASRVYLFMLFWLVYRVVETNGKIVDAQTHVSNVKVTRCQTERPSENEMNRMVAYEDTAQFRVSAAEEQNAGFVFPLVFHVFESPEGFITVPDPVFPVQVDHINHVFASTNPTSNIQFTLRRVEKRVNDSLARNCLASMYKPYLHKLAASERDAIHVYVCNMNRGGHLILGQARLPCAEDYELNGAVFDGAMWIHFGAFRDVKGVYQAERSFNEGDTLVHVFGLLHTFSETSQCKGPGDYIADTPAQKLANTAGCVLTKDTCPNEPGYDPVQNFMDYSPDACMDRFSPLQVKRMRSEINRCFVGRFQKIGFIKECTTSGKVGPASKGSVCRTGCRRSRMPNRKLPKASAPWCKTIDGKWGGVCRCKKVVLSPTSSPSSSPTPRPSQAPIVATLAPSDAPSVSPTHTECRGRKKKECDTLSHCTFLSLTARERRRLPAACVAAVGCRDISTWCKGLCPKVCSLKKASCKLSKDNQCVKR